MQIKTTMLYHFTLIRKATIQINAESNEHNKLVNKMKQRYGYMEQGGVMKEGEGITYIYNIMYLTYTHRQQCDDSRERVVGG